LPKIKNVFTRAKGGKSSVAEDDIVIKYMQVVREDGKTVGVALRKSGNIDIYSDGYLVDYQEKY
jgi:hypothetical protein